MEDEMIWNSSQKYEKALKLYSKMINRTVKPDPNKPIKQFIFCLFEQFIYSKTSKPQ